MKYKLIYQDRPETLEDKINQAADNGWILMEIIVKNFASASSTFLAIMKRDN